MKKNNNSKKCIEPVTTNTVNETNEYYESLRNDIIDDFLLAYGTADDEEDDIPEEMTEVVDSTDDEDEYSGVPDDDELDRRLDDFIRSESSVMDEEGEDVEYGAQDGDIQEDMDESSCVLCSEIDNEDKDEFLGPGISLLKSMDFLVGLDRVKGKLAEYEKVVRFNSWRNHRKLPLVPMPLHAMFLGSPGTGKTTVAKMMGLMLHRAGVLSRGHVVVRERSSLMGGCYGDQEAKTMEAISEADGGILLIDEAYQLHQPDDPRDPGKYVVETLLTALADESRRDWMLILAGYPDEMLRMFDMNPGLSSRIPEANIYVFDDLDEGQLMQVAERYFDTYEYTLSSEAHIALAQRIAVDYACRDRSFGNARYVRNLIQTGILPAMATRVVDTGTYDRQALTTIQATDIPAPMRFFSRGRRPVGFVA